MIDASNPSHHKAGTLNSTYMPVPGAQGEKKFHQFAEAYRENQNFLSRVRAAVLSPENVSFPIPPNS